ncbi:hypothetical protein P20439_1790 [Pseudoalteromonas sp. BSi20439]|nr:hypothetical protein P20439_1790 [Pseudoalteromonas sp. BSi20439]
MNVILQLFVNLTIHPKKVHYSLKYSGLYTNCLRSINWSEVYKSLQK